MIPDRWSIGSSATVAILTSNQQDPFMKVLSSLNDVLNCFTKTERTSVDEETVITQAVSIVDANFAALGCEFKEIAFSQFAKAFIGSMGHFFEERKSKADPPLIEASLAHALCTPGRSIDLMQNLASHVPPRDDEDDDLEDIASPSFVAVKEEETINCLSSNDEEDDQSPEQERSSSLPANNRKRRRILPGREQAEATRCIWNACRAQFSSGQELCEHIRSDHLKPSSRDCSWDGCTSSFAKKYALIRHIMAHINYRPHVCTFDGCDAGFLSSGDLQKHEKIHGDRYL